MLQLANNRYGRKILKASFYLPPFASIFSRSEKKVLCGRIMTADIVLKLKNRSWEKKDGRLRVDRMLEHSPKRWSNMPSSLKHISRLRIISNDDVSTYIFFRNPSFSSLRCVFSPFHYLSKLCYQSWRCKKYIPRLKVIFEEYWINRERDVSDNEWWRPTFSTLSSHLYPAICSLETLQDLPKKLSAR